MTAPIDREGNGMAEPELPAIEWQYSTFVFKHSSEKASRNFGREMFERYPFGAGGDDSSLCAVSVGDAMSVSDAMRMALECGALDPSERSDLALEMAERGTWEGCMALAKEWGLTVGEWGDFINAGEEKAA